MTEPDDLTELSARNKEAEDVTVLSRRNQAPPIEDEDDDSTRLTSRSEARAASDTTQLSRRGGDAGERRAAPSGRAGLAPLPPGAGAAEAERGIFGQPAQEYAPREVPADAPSAPRPAAQAMPTPDDGLNLAAARSRREAARHRRLITAVVVVCITAAVMTAAIIGIVALIRAQS
jgi:hypothetical protein